MSRSLPHDFKLTQGENNRSLNETKNKMEMKMNSLALQKMKRVNVAVGANIELVPGKRRRDLNLDSYYFICLGFFYILCALIFLVFLGGGGWM